MPPPPTRRRTSFPRTVQGRRRLRTVAILAGAGLLGYLAAFVAFPAKLVSEDHSVAPVFGLTEADAVAELTRLGFKVKTGDAEPDPVQPAGSVIWQDPAGYTVLEEGATVRLILSSGPAPVPIPDVAGFDTDLATRTLGLSGLRVGAVDSMAAGAEEGIVVATRPGAGAGRAVGTAVDLVVSRGPADTRIPELVGASEEEARQRLEAAGLRVGRVSSRTAGRILGPTTGSVVLEQRPAAGTLIPRGARVDLVVSRLGGARP